MCRCVCGGRGGMLMQLFHILPWRSWTEKLTCIVYLCCICPRWTKGCQLLIISTPRLICRSESSPLEADVSGLLVRRQGTHEGDIHLVALTQCHGCSSQWYTEFGGVTGNTQMKTLESRSFSAVFLQAALHVQECMGRNYLSVNKHHRRCCVLVWFYIHTNSLFDLAIPSRFFFILLMILHFFASMLI